MSDIKSLEKKEGLVRGEKFRTHASFIIFKNGKEGLRKVEKELKALGHPLVLEDAGTFKWYPAFLHPMILMILKDILDWSNEDIFEMGTYSAKLSFMNRVLVRYMVSTEKALSKAPQMWRNYYDIGNLKAVDFNENKKWILIHLFNFDMHPLVCIYNSGYILQSMRNAVRGSNMNIEETKCIHKGDDYHEYKVTWE